MCGTDIYAANIKCRKKYLIFFWSELRYILRKNRPKKSLVRPNRNYSKYIIKIFKIFVLKHCIFGHKSNKFMVLTSFDTHIDIFWRFFCSILPVIFYLSFPFSGCQCQSVRHFLKFLSIFLQSLAPKSANPIAPLNKTRVEYPPLKIRNTVLPQQISWSALWYWNLENCVCYLLEMFENKT